MSVIMRKWTAIVRSTDVADYTRYVETTGVEDYQGIDGNLGHQIVVRDLADGTSEFSTLSWWSSMEAIRAFAGEKPELARYYPEDDQYLLSRPETVEHFEVVSGKVPAL